MKSVSGDVMRRLSKEERYGGEWKQEAEAKLKRQRPYDSQEDSGDEARAVILDDYGYVGILPQGQQAARSIGQTLDVHNQQSDSSGSSCTIHSGRECCLAARTGSRWDSPLPGILRAYKAPTYLGSQEADLLPLTLAPGITAWVTRRSQNLLHEGGYAYRGPLGVWTYFPGYPTGPHSGETIRPCCYCRQDTCWFKGGITDKRSPYDDSSLFSGLEISGDDFSEAFCSEVAQTNSVGLLGTDWYWEDPQGH